MLISVKEIPISIMTSRGNYKYMVFEQESSSRYVNSFFITYKDSGAPHVLTQNNLISHLSDLVNSQKDTHKRVQLFNDNNDVFLPTGLHMQTTEQAFITTLQIEVIPWHNKTS